MDMSEIATKMLEWEKLKREADSLAAEIEAAVLEIGKTQTVGNVRVTYSEGRKSYDYEAAALSSGVTQAQVDDFISEVVDWRGLCKGLDIIDIPFTQSDPTARIKLLN